MQAEKWDYSHMIKARQVDDKRRVLLPKEFRPGSDVIFERLDEYTWLLKRPQPSANIKIVAIPVIDRLPDDPEWDKVERAFCRAATDSLPPPEDD